MLPLLWKMYSKIKYGRYGDRQKNNDGYSDKKLFLHYLKIKLTIMATLIPRIAPITT